MTTKNSILLRSKELRRTKQNPAKPVAKQEKGSVEPESTQCDEHGIAEIEESDGSSTFQKIKPESTATASAYDPTDPRNRNSQTSEQFERELRNEMLAKRGSPEWRKGTGKPESPQPNNDEMMHKLLANALEDVAYWEKHHDAVQRANNKLHQRLADAERLAEALSKIKTSMEHYFSPEDKHWCINKATEALAQWETATRKATQSSEAQK